MTAIMGAEKTGQVVKAVSLSPATLLTTALAALSKGAVGMEMNK